MGSGSPIPEADAVDRFADVEVSISRLGDQVELGLDTLLPPAARQCDTHTELAVGVVGLQDETLQFALAYDVVIGHQPTNPVPGISKGRELLEVEILRDLEDELVREAAYVARCGASSATWWCRYSSVVAGSRDPSRRASMTEPASAALETSVPPISKLERAQVYCRAAIVLLQGVAPKEGQQLNCHALQGVCRSVAIAFPQNGRANESAEHIRVYNSRLDGDLGRDEGVPLEEDDG